MNFIFQIFVIFEFVYNVLDGLVGMWQKGGFDRFIFEEFRFFFIEEDQNFRNLERSSVDFEFIIFIGSLFKLIYGFKFSLEFKRLGGRLLRQYVLIVYIEKLLILFDWLEG